MTDWRKLDREVDRLKAESLTRAEVLLREVGRNRELAGRVAEREAEILMLRALLADGRDGHRTKAWHVAVAEALDEPVE